MTLHILHVPIDMRQFNRWVGIRSSLGAGHIDSGFGLHTLLTEAFGRRVIQPFRLFASERRALASLYGYSEFDSDNLREKWESYATPDCVGVLDLDALMTKPMYVDFDQGKILGFDIRIRPIRRLFSDIYDSSRNKLYKAHSEVDAFVSHILKLEFSSPNQDKMQHSIKTSREDIYRSWFAERIRPFATVLDFRLTSFCRSRALFGKGRAVEGPDAIVHGDLCVDEVDGFKEAVKKGVGRYKAYGYGMLLLRPPVSSSNARRI